MADNDPDLMAEFQEFLANKKAKEDEDAAAEDFEVEIWDEKGRGIRTRRSHAKPFLQSLGIDLDPEPPADDNSGDSDGKGKRKAPPKGAAAPQAQSVTRKYFASRPKGQ